jgi:hypothetical protein
MRTTNLHEFSLYPDRQPISQDEFKTLLSGIEKVAKGCGENLHLILGSVAVRGNGTRGAGFAPSFHNLVMYVVCGLTPAIRCRSKVYKDQQDFDFEGFSSFAHRIFTQVSGAPKVPAPFATAAAAP